MNSSYGQFGHFGVSAYDAALSEKGFKRWDWSTFGKDDTRDWTQSDVADADRQQRMFAAERGAADAKSKTYMVGGALLFFGLIAGAYALSGSKSKSTPAKVSDDE
jgi:hypothetical protein